MTLIPYVVERDGRGERSYDIYSRLLKDRIVFLGTAINHQVANAIVAQLLFLQQDNPEKPVRIYINSPGGSVYDGLAIYDTMRYLTCPVETICLGHAASMGSFLLAAGDLGRRLATPNSRIMLHQPSGGARGTAADIEITAKEIVYLRSRLNGIYAEHTGKTPEQIREDLDRDRWMSAEEAKGYGLIDHIIDLKPVVARKRWSRPSEAVQ